MSLPVPFPESVRSALTPFTFRKAKERGGVPLLRTSLGGTIRAFVNDCHLWVGRQGASTPDPLEDFVQRPRANPGTCTDCVVPVPSPRVMQGLAPSIGGAPVKTAGPQGRGSHRPRPWNGKGSLRFRMGRLRSRLLHVSCGDPGSPELIEHSWTYPLWTTVVHQPDRFPNWRAPVA